MDMTPYQAMPLSPLKESGNRDFFFLMDCRRRDLRYWRSGNQRENAGIARESDSPVEPVFSRLARIFPPIPAHLLISGPPDRLRQFGSAGKIPDSHPQVLPPPPGLHANPIRQGGGGIRYSFASTSSNLNKTRMPFLSLLRSVTLKEHG
jgi:hypothetical protein